MKKGGAVKAQGVAAEFQSWLGAGSGGTYIGNPGSPFPADSWNQMFLGIKIHACHCVLSTLRMRSCACEVCVAIRASLNQGPTCARNAHFVRPRQKHWSVAKRAGPTGLGEDRLWPKRRPKQTLGVDRYCCSDE